MRLSIHPSTRVSEAGLSIRLLGVAGLVLLAAAGCGKKGPPLAPFVRVPAAVTAVTPLRVGDDVFVTFEVPSTNVDGQKPASIEALEIYAVTSERAPETEEQRKAATLVATLPVRPILPAPPAPVNGSAPQPIPLPPGVDQGTPVTIRETLTPEARMPIELPVDEKASKLPVTLEPRLLFEDEEPVTPVLVAPPPSQLPRRRYFVIGIGPRGRKSTPSTPAAVPLEPGSSAPGAPVITNTETELTITWPPSPDARTSTVLLPPTVKPDPTAKNATPANVSPKVPAPLPPLQAKSLGFDTQPTKYHVYDATPMPPADPSTVEDPFAIKAPAPLTALAVVDTEHVIKGVTFGVERCFQVRPVDQIFGVTVIGPASPTTCVTPQDTFPPAAPKSLAAIAGSGVINLIWDANTESDLAGYIVLRGAAPGDTLQAITPEPITVTSYRDETVKPGTRYVYAVVAVDKSMPQNVSPQSNRAEETARQ